MDLVNKVAIITGSAQGLGKAFAARLLEVGVKVCISDVNQEKGEAALSELKERFGENWRSLRPTIANASTSGGLILRLRRAILALRLHENLIIMGRCLLRLRLRLVVSKSVNLRAQRTASELT